MPRDFFAFTNSRPPKMNEEDEFKQNQTKVLEFIYQVLRKKCEPEDFVSFIKDGDVISEILMRSCSTPLGRKKSLSKHPSQIEKIEKIINDLFEFGVAVEYLFHPKDLIEEKNIPLVTKALADVCMIVYTGQGRSRLKSVSDVTKGGFRCSACQEKYAKSNQLREHLFKEHPDKIGPNLRKILEKYRDL